MKIKTALISVYNKEGLMPMVKKMASLGIKIYSTGGTYDYIRAEGYDATPVEDVTGVPSIFEGRVKTLHPLIMGGILFRRDVDDDLDECIKYNIPSIDLVVIDLYPFIDTVKSNASEQEIIEKIDIGGISLIRAAAKNFKDVVIIPDSTAYSILDDILDNGGKTNLQKRKELAARAFDISSHFDTAVYNWLSKETFAPSLKISVRDVTPLRYGENPHQKGFYYGDTADLPEQLHGKTISYNNLLDIDAAINLIDEFDQPAVAIIKHNNACGLAVRENVTNAWNAALQADPTSAFGGIIISNRDIEKEVSEEINKIFFEVIIAPSYSSEALKVLKQKKNRIILKNSGAKCFTKPLKNVLSGYLVQDIDSITEGREDMNVVTERNPDNREFNDLLLANKIVKHTKSNAIVIVKNSQLIGSGTGQTSRVDAMDQAIEKARRFNLSLDGAVVASDAFFPFSDNVEIAHKAGIGAIIQPGGSIRDNESINFCNKHNIAMVFTGVRHFKH